MGGVWISTPRVSILIAAYNAEDTLAETLASVIHQRYEGWEAIIVDDGSVDGTGALATTLALTEPRIRVIHQRNAGTALARNRAAGAASGEWLLPLDADDLLAPEALSAQLEFIDAHAGYDVYSWSSWLLFPDGGVAMFDDSPEYSARTEFTLQDLIVGNRLLSHTMISANAFRSIGGYRDVYVEDYDLWLRALARGFRHLHNPAILACYRQGRGKNSDERSSRVGTAAVLEDLADSGLTDGPLARLARGRAASLRALAERAGLEERLRAGDYRGAGSSYWAARQAFHNPIKRWLGLGLALVRPSLLARIVVPRDPDSREAGQ